VEYAGALKEVAFQEEGESLSLFSHLYKLDDAIYMTNFQIQVGAPGLAKT